jgi:uncharacterized membrane protein YdjX (TVP38/TMEM64 family)
MVEYFLYWVSPILADHPFVAPIIFIAIHIALAACFLPCSPMALMAGALWGGGYGLLISVVAATAASASTFLLSRSFLHDKIEQFLKQRYPKAAEMLTQAAEHDWKIIAVSQMNPLMPSSTLGYVFGLSKVSFRRYLVFTLVFMLPLQLLFVMTGHSLVGLFISGVHWGVATALLALVVTFVLMGKRIYKYICQLFGVNNGS